MIHVFKSEQYGGGTFGIALFALDHQSWYCGALLPRRIRKEGGDYANVESARTWATRWNEESWRYMLRDADGGIIGGTDSASDAIDFARAIVGKRSALMSDDYVRRLSTIRIHDRDEGGRVFFEVDVATTSLSS